MKLTFIANAACIYETNGFRILSDPWFTDGVFEGAWAHYPPVKTRIKNLIPSINAIYISHLHPDHYSPIDMADVPRETPIIYLDHEPNYLRKILDRDGFTNLIGIKHRDTKVIGPFSLTMWKAWCLNPWQTGEMGNPLDSALVFDDGKYTVLNTNDATPTLKGCEELLTKHGKFDLAQLQFNGAGPFPACFEMTDTKRLRAHELLMRRNKSYLLDMARALDARFIMPFAGQYIIQGKNWELNAILGTMTPWQAGNYLRRFNLNPIFLAEGETFDLSKPRMRRKKRLWTKKEMMNYAESNEGVKYPYEKLPAKSYSDCVDIFSKALERVRATQIRLNVWPECCVHINNCLYIDMGKGDETDNVLKCTIDWRLLFEILEGRIHWNNAEIGCHIFFERKGPYLPDVHLLLSYLHA